MRVEFISVEEPSRVLFQGLDLEIDFDPVLNMAAEYFTHLGIVCAQRFSSLSMSANYCVSY